MSISDLVKLLRKRWRVLSAVLLLCVVVGVLLSVLPTKQYEATAQVFVSTSGDSSGGAAQLAEGNSFVQARVQSYTDVATSPSVIDFVASQAGSSVSADELSTSVTADAPLNKVLINLHVRNSSATLAALLANRVALRFNDVVGQLETSSTGAASPVKLTLVKPAVAPSSAVTPNPTLNISISLLVGLVLALLAAILRETLDNTFKDSTRLNSETDVPVLGVIPLDKQVANNPIASRSNKASARAESFRQMRSNLQYLNVDGSAKVIAITSALPGDGKTHTAINVAASLAEAGQRVCLIDADLRRPSVARLLGLVPSVGLTSVLIGQTSVEDVMQNAGLNLAVLASGALPPNPSELIASAQLRATLTYIAERVDVVVLDTAPLLPVADGAEVAALSDVTILVVRASRTTIPQVRHALEILSKVGVRLAGCVLSMAGSAGLRQYGYYYYQEGDGSQALEESLPDGTKQEEVAPVNLTKVT